KHGNTAVFNCDIVDELLDNHRFADASATKRAHLAAFCKWANKIDDLDPRFQNLCRSVLLGEHRRRAMDWVALRVVHRATVINREIIVEFRQSLFVRKFHVLYGNDYLNYVSFIHKS